MRKEDKAIVIEHIGEKLKEYAHFYLVDVTGMNAESTSNLRRKCFGADIKMLLLRTPSCTRHLRQPRLTTPRFMAV